MYCRGLTRTARSCSVTRLSFLGVDFEKNIPILWALFLDQYTGASYIKHVIVPCCYAMAFFNLTQLGVQDPIKTAASSTTAPSTGGASSEPTHNGSYEKYTTMLKKHQRNEKGVLALFTGTYTTVFCLLNVGPNELYNTPVTTSMNYGRWMKDGHTKQQSWTHVPRRAHVNSEMTRSVIVASPSSLLLIKVFWFRFVDEMSLTNRDFSLF